MPPLVLFLLVASPAQSESTDVVMAVFLGCQLYLITSRPKLEILRQSDQVVPRAGFGIGHIPRQFFYRILYILPINRHIIASGN